MFKCKSALLKRRHRFRGHFRDMFILDIFIGVMAGLLYGVEFYLKTKHTLFLKILVVVSSPFLGALATALALLLLMGLGVTLDWVRYDLPKRWRSKQK